MRIISLGAGVQSSALLLMSDREKIPRADAAIFSDTGAEPDKVYDWLEMLKKSVSIPIYTTSSGNLFEDILGAGRFAAIPFFTISKNGKPGLMKRQCTYEYKIAPVEKKTRELLGLKPRQHVKTRVEMMIGFSIDEIYRVNRSRPGKAWMNKTYPLIDLRMSRQDCIEYVQKEIGEKPPRSACWFCPFHNDYEWAQIKNNDPKGWEASLKVEAAINANPRFKSQAFLHSSRKPLNSVEFYTGEDQPDLFNQICGEGMCGL